MFRKRLLAHRMGMVGIVVIFFNLSIAMLAPWISTHDPLKIDIAHRASPPSRQFLFGTDDFGRDIFSRVIYGSRISIYISVLSVLVATVFGVWPSASPCGQVLSGVWGEDVNGEEWHTGEHSPATVPTPHLH